MSRLIPARPGAGQVTMDRLSGFVDTLWLNLLWLAGCATVVGAPAATTAMIAVVAERREGVVRPVLAHFVEQARARFARATAFGAGWLLGGLVLWADLQIVAAMDHLRTPLTAAVTVLIILYGLAGVLLFQVLATTELRGRAALKAAVLMSWLAPGHAAQSALATVLAVLAVMTMPLTIFVVGALAAHVMAARWQRSLTKLDGLTAHPA